MRTTIWPSRSAAAGIKRPLSECLAVLDEAGVKQYVDLDGGWGEEILQRHLDHFKQPAPDRFAIFGGVDWDRVGREAQSVSAVGGAAFARAGQVGRAGPKDLETVRLARARSATISS